MTTCESCKFFCPSAFVDVCTIEQMTITSASGDVSIDIPVNATDKACDKYIRKDDLRNE